LNGGQMRALAVIDSAHAGRSLSSDEDAAAFQDELIAEYLLARSARGVGDRSVRQELSAIEEFLSFCGVWAWEVEPTHADRFLGKNQASLAPATRRGKAQKIHFFFRFLEHRYQGELLELTGRVVTSPIDEVNRPLHSGDFTVRVPPSSIELGGFFESWRQELAHVRKWRNAARTYTMARTAAEVGLRARELCQLALDDLHFDHGPLGKIHVRFGKGARGSGPRARLVPMLGDARSILTWWVKEVRGQFGDDFDRPLAPAFPSERSGALTSAEFRRLLVDASRAHLPDRTPPLTPHVLRHACASRLYGEGVSLPAIQRLLGHRWLNSTMGYVHVADEAIEAEYVRAAEVAAARLGAGRT
jgi:integrase/recombinase XerD